MACNAPRLKTFLEKLLKFSNAGPFIPDYTCGNMVRQRFGFTRKFSGCKDRPYRNFTTAVAEGKTRRLVRSKTQLHMLHG